MRFCLISILFILIGCRSIDVDWELMNNLDIQELRVVQYRYQKAHHFWPSAKTWDSIKHTNSRFRRFGKLTGDTSMVSYQIQYNPFENSFQSIAINEYLRLADTPGIVSVQIVELILQGNIQLGTRTKLTTYEKKLYHRWERIRVNSRKLLVENPETKKQFAIRIGDHLFASSKIDSLGYVNPVYDSTTKRLNLYPSQEWVLKRINPSDSTIEIQTFGLKKNIRTKDIDFVNLKNKRGKYKIIGIAVDMARNK